MPTDYTPSGSPTAFTIPAYADVVDGPAAFTSFADDVFAGLLLKSDKSPTVNAQTGTTYTFATTDLGKTVTLSNASPVTLTLSTALSGLATGAILRIVNLGAGLVTVTPSGTTIAGTPLTLATNKGASIIKTGTNAYVMLPFSGGDVAAVATGGTESTLTNPDGDGKNYRLHVFNSNSSLVVSTAGYMDVLVVAGGANSFGGAASPGNGGRIVFGRHWIPAATHTITVGAVGEPSTLGTVLNSGPSKTSLDTNNGTGAGGTSGSIRLGFASSITGSSVTYATCTASPTANRGDGNLNGTGATGVIIVRREI